MYLKLLKELYCKERKKLEEMWVYQEESLRNIIKLRRDIVEKLQDSLSVTELLGRADIREEIKDNLLKDENNEDKLRIRLERNFDEEINDINKEEKELGDIKYSASEYADYLLQMEKVRSLESELVENGLITEEVYNGQGQTK